MAKKVSKSAVSKDASSKRKTSGRAVASKNAKPIPKKVHVPEVLDSDDLEDSPEPILNGPPIEPDDLETLEIIETPELDAPAKVPSSSRGLTTTDPINQYMAEVRKYPLLTREKELEIAQKYYETKDPALAQILVTSNLRFVVKVAAEYSKFGARLIDLVQEGNMGLMHAVREFNPYRGVRVITYAVWWIRGYIQEYLMKQYSLVKIGTTQNQKKLFYKLQKEKESLDALNGHENLKLLSEKLGIPEEEVEVMARRLSGRDVSLDRPIDHQNPTRLLEMQSGTSAPPDEELSMREQLADLKETIAELRPTLSEREQIILDERLLNDEPLTLQEIGDKHGITREAVRQMEVRVMKKIKDHFQKT